MTSRLPPSDPPPQLRVVHVAVQPRTWLGKLLAAVAAVAVMIVALVLSLFAFVIVASVLAAGLLAFLWQSRRVHRSMRTFDVTPERHDEESRSR